MAISKIQWTDLTWNPWHGCTKVSPGCKFCYMYRGKERFKKDPSLVLKSKTRFREPLSWSEAAKVFTCSWSDFFIPEADPWREEAWSIIRKTPHLTYQILTKRPERIAECLPEDWGSGYPNVWLGASVETAAIAELRIPVLLTIPCSVHFVSAEPLLENILNRNTEPLLAQLQWVIIGGESGNNTGKWRYRPTEILWIEELVEFCDSNRVSCFVKQLGSHLAQTLSLKDRVGGVPDEWSAALRKLEFPL